MAIRSRNPPPTQRCGRIRELQGVGRSWMNHACVRGMRNSRNLYCRSYRTVGAAKQLSPSPSKQKGIFLFSFSSLDIGALDATISARREFQFPFPVNGNNGRSDIHLSYEALRSILFPFQDSTPFTAASARRGATLNIGGASKAAGTALLTPIM